MAESDQPILATFEPVPPQDSSLTPMPEVKLIDWALEIAGSPEKLGEWVQMPLPALAGRTPYEALQTKEGRFDLERVLGQIDHGIY